MASILVIDDDRAVLATIKVLLERAAHAVEAVDNSRDGLQLIETRSFDLLIVDIFMPGMDGFETMRLVHQSRPEMPVLRRLAGGWLLLEETGDGVGIL